MNRPSTATLTAGTFGGLSNVGVVLALYARDGYPTLESPVETAVLVLTAFVTGFALTFVSAYTRLLSPAVGFLGILGSTVVLDLNSPRPEWHELHGYVIVDGPTHIASYANTWYVWLALFLFAGVVEFGVRSGYQIGAGRLRNLPELPLTPVALTWVVVSVSGFVGVATTLLVFRSGIEPSLLGLIVLVVGTLVALVPLAALLSHGVVVPMLLFGLVVPYALGLEVFTTTDSPVHILLFGPYVLVLASVWLLEKELRSRLRGWDGGRFVKERPVD